MIKVAVVVLHYKGIDLTRECLQSLAKMDKKGIELRVVVVNSGTSEPFNEKVKDLDVEFINSMENLGYVGGNNVGIRKAMEIGNEYIWVLNNDTIVDKNCLKILVEVAERTHWAGILGPKIYFAPGYEFHKDWYEEEDKGKVIWWAGGRFDWDNVQTIHVGVNEVDHGQFGIGGPLLKKDGYDYTDLVTGAAMFVRRRVFEEVGLFDENYFLYFEDADFCRRVDMSNLRWGLYFVPSAFLWHKNAGSSGSGSALHDYYLTRNRLLFGFRYAPNRTKLALFRESLRMLISGRPWQKRGVLDFYLGRFGKGSFAI